MAKKLEIVATLGPSVTDKISDLILAGATAFRLNCSHLNIITFSDWIQKLTTIFKQNNHFLPVWLDLQGAKLRIGKLEKPIFLKNNKSVVFSNIAVQTDEYIPLPHPQVYNSIETNDKISLNDGKIELIVEEIYEHSFKAKVIAGGTLKSFKGFNKANYTDDLYEIHPRDLTFIQKTKHFKNIGYAVSFIQSENEIRLVKKYTANRPVICKVERLKTFDKLVNIAKITDGMWLCRGDLGIEANIYNLFEFEKIFIQRLNNIHKPYLIAGQVFQHMVTSNHPARSEVAHLSYLIENGFNGIVLSDETAIGKYPVETVNFCNKFLKHIVKMNFS